MREFDIYVPLTFNDGTDIPEAHFLKLQQALFDQFDGLTLFPQPNQGFWKMGDVTYKDDVVIYRVMAEDAPRARRILSRLRKWLKHEFKQEEILIVQRTVRIIH